MSNIEIEKLNTAYDYDVLSSKTSRNETNHFHVYVDDDADYRESNGKFVVDNLSTEQYGSLIHEYVHYIQHIQTIYGVNRSRIHNRLFVEYRRYLLNNEIIELPLSPQIVCPKALSIFKKESEKEGCQQYSHNIDIVDIRRIDIENARNKKQSVRIGIYDVESGDVLYGEKGYHFGYWAIIEGMAHHIQVLVDPTAEERHLTVPYKIVDLVCEAMYPEINKDNLLKIAMCMIALTYDNPGVGFFDVADFVSSSKIYDGRSLYRKFLCNKISFRGEQITIKEMLRKTQNELKELLEVVTGIKSDYYQKVFGQTNEEISTGESTLLNIIYDGSIKDKSVFTDKLLNVYGLPLIESHISSILPFNHETGKLYKETALLASWELLYKRLVSKDSTKCMRYEMCQSGDNLTIECRDVQWQKNEPCLLSDAFRLYATDVKEWIQ